MIDGRLYAPTAQVTFSDGPEGTFEIDAIASMCAIVNGEIRGKDANILAALVLQLSQQAGGTAGTGLGNDLQEFIESHRRLIADGYIGCDEHGGFMKVPNVSAALG